MIILAAIIAAVVSVGAMYAMKMLGLTESVAVAGAIGGAVGGALGVGIAGRKSE